MAAEDDSDENYIVRIADLRRWLPAISAVNKHWELQAIGNTFEGGEYRSYIDIRYWNELNAPNELCFRFPVTAIERENNFDDLQRFVFLHPSLAIAVSEGMYFEGSTLKYDCLEDWLQFCPALFAAVSASAARERRLGTLEPVPTRHLTEFAIALLRAENEIDALTRLFNRKSHSRR